MKKLQKLKLIVIATALSVGTFTSMPVFAASAFISNPITSTYSNPGSVTTAGGSLWYIESNGGTYAYIGNMTTSGTTTDYNIRTLSGKSTLLVGSITTGPDGNVWFTAYVSTTSVYAGVLNISTGTVTLYASGIPSYGNFGPIVTGSDGNLWYYVKSASNNKTYLVNLNPSTGVTTSTYISSTFNNFTSIAAGPDGNLWITDAYYNRVNSFTTAGSMSGSYNVPGSVSPHNIAAGPDGNLWFRAGGKILKVTPSGSFTSYTPAAGVSPNVFVAGTDGAIWFTDTGSTKKIGRITTSGTITEYTVPGSSVSNLSSMALGPNGAMWFSYSDSGGSKIGSLTVTPDFSTNPISATYVNPGSVTTAGGSLWYIESNGGTYAYIGNMTTTGTTSDYDIRTLSGNTSLTFGSLTTGPDGNVWFNVYDGSGASAGKLDISTGAVTLYASGIPSYGNFGPIVTGSDGNLWYYVKSASNNKTYLVYVNPSTGVTTSTYMSDTFADFTSIAAGPDGNLWITDAYYKRVYKFTTAGSMSGSYNVPGSVSPYSITPGPDGNLWLRANGDILKVTTSGSFTSYTPAAGVSPSVLVAGNDGAVWFTDTSSTNKIGRITTSGTITLHTIPGTSVSNLSSLALGPDGAIWFSYADSNGNKLGRLGY